MKKLKFDVSSWEKVQKKPGEFGRIFLGISVGLLKRSSKERTDSLELNRIRNQLTMYQTANSTVESIYISSAASDLILSSGSLLLASELEEFPDEGIQRLLEHTEELLDVIGDMEQSGTGSREVTLDGGEKYFVSCLHSEASGWDYIKITRWNEVFGILRSLTEWTIIIVAVIVGLMLLMIARSAVSVLRLQRLL